MSMELDSVLGKERVWKNHLGRLDSGSFCENGSNDYKLAHQIYTKYKELADLLLEHEREGYKFP